MEQVPQGEAMRFWCAMAPGRLFVGLSLKGGPAREPHLAGI